MNTRAAVLVLVATGGACAPVLAYQNQAEVAALNALVQAAGAVRAEDVERLVEAARLLSAPLDQAEWLVEQLAGMKDTLAADVLRQAIERFTGRLDELRPFVERADDLNALLSRLKAFAAPPAPVAPRSLAECATPADLAALLAVKPLSQLSVPERQKAASLGARVDSLGLRGAPLRDIKPITTLYSLLAAAGDASDMLAAAGGISGDDRAALVTSALLDKLMGATPPAPPGGWNALADSLARDHAFVWAHVASRLAGAAQYGDWIQAAGGDLPGQLSAALAKPPPSAGGGGGGVSTEQVKAKLGQAGGTFLFYVDTTAAGGARVLYPTFGAGDLVWSETTLAIQSPADLTARIRSLNLRPLESKGGVMLVVNDSLDQWAAEGVNLLKYAQGELQVTRELFVVCALSSSVLDGRSWNMDQSLAHLYQQARGSGAPPWRVASNVSAAPIRGLQKVDVESAGAKLTLIAPP